MLGLLLISAGAFPYEQKFGGTHPGPHWICLCFIIRQTTGIFLKSWSGAVDTSLRMCTPLSLLSHLIDLTSYCVAFEPLSTKNCVYPKKQCFYNSAFISLRNYCLFQFLVTGFPFTSLTSISTSLLLISDEIELAIFMKSPLNSFHPVFQANTSPAPH